MVGEVLAQGLPYLYNTEGVMGLLTTSIFWERSSDIAANFQLPIRHGRICTIRLDDRSRGVWNCIVAVRMYEKKTTCNMSLYKSDATLVDYGRDGL